jgi:hypothetical protein
MGLLPDGRKDGRKRHITSAKGDALRPAAGTDLQAADKKEKSSEAHDTQQFCKRPDWHTFVTVLGLKNESCTNGFSGSLPKLPAGRCCKQHPVFYFGRGKRSPVTV